MGIFKMKWWNKDKDTRRNDWFTVSAPTMDAMIDAGLWCRNSESTGKFYNHYTNTRWWFEKEEDAIMFSLTWGDK